MKLRARIGIALSALLLLASCGSADDSSNDTSQGSNDNAASSSGDSGTDTTPVDDNTTITVWAHQGQESEVDALQQAIDGFNSADNGITAELQLVPEGDYMSSVTTTGAKNLPDVIEFDGPMMASLIYGQKLAPIDDIISTDTIANQNPSVLAQNTNPADGKLYGVSQFDGALGMYGNAELLEAAGVDYPTTWEDAWTSEEFEAALHALAAIDEDGRVLDIKESYGGDWPTFGFLPVAWSAGDRLVVDGVAEGHINSPAVVAAVSTFASWRDLADPNTDDKAFQEGRVALSWVGHWMYNPYAEALGDKLVVLPLPDFGVGAKTGQGSWAWGINPTSDKGPAAAAFLDYLTGDDLVAAMTDANAAPPATKTVTAASALYGPDGPLALFASQLDATCGSDALTTSCVAVPRPMTPAYPVISEEFSAAFFDAYSGGDAQELLDSAARAIDLDFQDNDGYGLN